MMQGCEAVMSRHVLKIAQGSSVVYVWEGILWRLVGIELTVEENLKENDAKEPPEQNDEEEVD